MEEVEGWKSGGASPPPGISRMETHRFGFEVDDWRCSFDLRIRGEYIT